MPFFVSKGKSFTMTIIGSLQAGPQSGWPKSVDRNNETAIDGAIIDNSVYTDFLQFINCDSCTLAGSGMMDGQGTPWYIAFDQKKIGNGRPNFVVINGGSNFKMLDLTLLNSPKFNVKFHSLKGGEFARVNITSEWYDGGKMEPHNTDGIDPGGDSSNIHIHHCYIHNGDDSVAVKPGTEAGGCTRDILVENCHFEKGHGCSIGSVGKGCVQNVVFRNITMVGEEAGCRIKSYSDSPGFVKVGF
jgi:polygalacturonase